MSLMLRGLFAVLVLVDLAIPVQAGQLTLIYSGVAADGSSLPSGDPIVVGSPFEVRALFPDLAIAVIPGVGFYQPTAVTAKVGGVLYVDQNLSVDIAELIDPTSGYAGFIPSLFTSAGASFAPGYLTAAPPLDGTAAAPTQFSGYVESFGTNLSLLTAGGPLVLFYDPTVGIATSIVGVDASIDTPEPGGLALIGAVLMAVWGRRRFLA